MADRKVNDDASIEGAQALRCPYCKACRWRVRMVAPDSLVVECVLCERDATLYWEGLKRG